jgi:ATP-dependent RNA helicase SUPV3L1/SUV3
MEQGGGIYCGPLRLLALEIYERLNREGVRASLLTGQERRDVPLATHVSCTVEMVNISKRYDIAVVDEIQMIGDHSRGHAWYLLSTRRVHLCIVIVSCV